MTKRGRSASAAAAASATTLVASKKQAIVPFHVQVQVASSSPNPNSNPGPVHVHVPNRAPVPNRVPVTEPFIYTVARFYVHSREPNATLFSADRIDEVCMLVPGAALVPFRRETMQPWNAETMSRAQVALFTTSSRQSGYPAAVFVAAIARMVALVPTLHPLSPANVPWAVLWVLGETEKLKGLQRLCSLVPWEHAMHKIETRERILAIKLKQREIKREQAVLKRRQQLIAANVDMEEVMLAVPDVSASGSGSGGPGGPGGGDEGMLREKDRVRERERIKEEAEHARRHVIKEDLRFFKKSEVRNSLFPAVPGMSWPAFKMFMYLVVFDELTVRDDTAGAEVCVIAREVALLVQSLAVHVHMGSAAWWDECFSFCHKLAETVPGAFSERDEMRMARAREVVMRAYARMCAPVLSACDLVFVHKARLTREIVLRYHCVSMKHNKPGPGIAAPGPVPGSLESGLELIRKQAESGGRGMKNKKKKKRRPQKDEDEDEEEEDEEDEDEDEDEEEGKGKGEENRNKASVPSPSPLALYTKAHGGGGGRSPGDEDASEGTVTTTGTATTLNDERAAKTSISVLGVHEIDAQTATLDEIAQEMIRDGAWGDLHDFTVFCACVRERGGGGGGGGGVDAHGLAFPAGDSGTKGAVSFSTLETTLRVLFRNHIMYEDEVGFFRSRNRVFLVASVDWIVSVQADALPFLACHSFFIRRHPVAIAPYIARRYIEGEKEKGNDDEQGEDFEKGLQGKAFAFKCMVRLVGGDDREFVVDEEGRVVIPRAFFFLHAIAALFDNPYQDIARSGVKPGGLLYALSALLDSANPDRLFSCLFSSGSGSGSGNAPPVAAPHRDIEDTYRWIAFGSADQKEARKRAFLDVRINKTLEVTKVFPGGPEWRLTREMYSQQVTRLFTSEAGVGAGKGKDGAPLCSMDRAHFPTVYGGLLELVSAVEENNYLAHDARAGMVRPSYIPAESFHMLRFSLVDFPFMLFPGSVAVGSAPVPARAWYMRDAFPVVKEVVSTEGAQKRYTAPFCYSSWLDTVITREICDAPVDAGM